MVQVEGLYAALLQYTLISLLSVQHYLLWELAGSVGYCIQGVSEHECLSLCPGDF